MGPVEEAGRATAGVLEALKTQPLAVALLVLNLLYIGAGFWIWRETMERRSDFVASILKSCLDVASKPSGFGPGVK